MRILGRPVRARPHDRGGARARPARRESRAIVYSYDMLGEARPHRGRRGALSAEPTRRDRRDRQRGAPAGLADVAPGHLGQALGAASALRAGASAAGCRRELLPRAARRSRAGATARTSASPSTPRRADRLELSLDILEALAADPALAGWDGLGLAVQAYQKRALPRDRLARRIWRGATGRRIPVRLVKGAYWDTEIKRAQELGLDDYPGLHAQGRDRRLLPRLRQTPARRRGRFYPQFATHNAHTLAAIHRDGRATGAEFEFQRLHGMGEALYDEVVRTRAAWPYPVASTRRSARTRICCAYLVRRLLENGANTLVRPPARRSAHEPRRADHRSGRSAPRRSSPSRTRRSGGHRISSGRSAAIRRAWTRERRGSCGLWRRSSGMRSGDPTRRAPRQAARVRGWRGTSCAIRPTGSRSWVR